MYTYAVEILTSKGEQATWLINAHNKAKALDLAAGRAAVLAANGITVSVIASSVKLD